MAQPVLAPFLTEHANSSNQRTMAADEALRTQCAQVKGGHFSVVAPLVAPLVVTNTTGHSGAGLDGQVPTVATGGHHALAAAHLVTIGYGERPGQDARAHGVGTPTCTITALALRVGRKLVEQVLARKAQS